MASAAVIRQRPWCRRRGLAAAACAALGSLLAGWAAPLAPVAFRLPSPARRLVTLHSGLWACGLLGPWLQQPLPANGEEAGTIKVAMPQEGPPLYSYQLPEGRFFPGVVDKEEVDSPGRIAKFEDSAGATILSGPLPAEDFVKKQRQGSLPSRLKVLKYELGEKEDFLECLVKLIQENGAIEVRHRWFRVLRDPSGEIAKSALLILEVPEDKLQSYSPAVQAILGSFKLGA